MSLHFDLCLYVIFSSILNVISKCTNLTLTSLSLAFVQELAKISTVQEFLISKDKSTVMHINIILFFLAVLAVAQVAADLDENSAKLLLYKVRERCFATGT